MTSAAATASPVQTRLQGDVLVVRIDNPPVNALGAAVRQGLMAAIGEAESRADVQAVQADVEARDAFLRAHGVSIEEWHELAAEHGEREARRIIEGRAAA